VNCIFRLNLVFLPYFAADTKNIGLMQDRPTGKHMIKTRQCQKQHQIHLKRVNPETVKFPHVGAEKFDLVMTLTLIPTHDLYDTSRDLICIQILLRYFKPFASLNNGDSVRNLLLSGMHTTLMSLHYLVKYKYLKTYYICR